MGVISTVVGQTETILINYVEAVFTYVAPPLQTTLKAAGILSLMFIAMNHIFQFRNVNYSTYITWGIRYVCIVSLATIWGNFQIFYDLCVNIPFEYMNALIPAGASYNGVVEAKMYNPANVTDIYTALDEFRHAIFYVADNIIHAFKLLKGSTYKYIPAAILVYIIGIIFTGASIVILLVAKLGFAIAMGLAPLAIAMLLFPQTKGYFESWLRFMGGFAVVPLLLASLMSVVITLAVNMQREDDIFKGFMPFVLVSLAGLVLLFQIPALASSLASTSMPQMGPGAMAGAIGSLGKTVSAPFTKALNTAKSINNVHSKGKDMQYVAKNARDSGAKGSGAGAAVRAMMMSSNARANLRDERKASKIPGYKASRQNDSSDTPQKSGASKSGGGSVLTPEQMARNR